MPRLILAFIGCLISLLSYSQTLRKGQVIDAGTKEPIAGASVRCSDADCRCGCSTNSLGAFEMNCTDCRTLTISYIGYAPRTLPVAEAQGLILLSPATSLMNSVVVTATRGEIVKRAQAPVAISLLSNKMIQDTKPASIDQVLNKVSGVNMVNLGNEQHQMSIRQPMTTKSLFLYLEDGIPVRTTGLFNHNALLEMNMAAVKQIEVIRGPSSSLYGSEAIGGVVNFISLAPTAVPVVKLSAQANTIGYKRGDLQASWQQKKWGFALSGYYADKRHSFMEFTDFHKQTWTARADYRFSNKTSVSSSLTWMRYYSDMPSGVDSLMFHTRTFVNPQTFTWRKVDALRLRSTITQAWNERSRTMASLIYRNNSIGQNPAYRIKDDYKKTGASWTGKKDLAHGEINESAFNSYALIAQHRQAFAWKHASLTGGLSADLSPSAYQADYIRIKKDTISRKYVAYTAIDSALTNYRTRINNYAAFGSFAFAPATDWQVVVSLRYDHFRYAFDNRLKPSAFSGSADTVNHFNRVSPKIGITYALNPRTGFYANYSEGFVPPQVTEMYTGVKVPALTPAVFRNYEAGGWAELVRNKLTVDLSLYRLEGKDEVVSVRLDDGSTENRNAGRTVHKGLEFSLTATPLPVLSIRMGGAVSAHRFEQFVEKGVSYNGNEMAGAPRWIHNAEAWYRPAFAKGLRLGAEWQHVGAYYVDPKNTSRYEGYHTLNLRAGYQHKGFEIWANLMNATDHYYAYLVTKSGSGYSYQLGEPRHLTLGLSYDLGSCFNKKP